MWESLLLLQFSSFQFSHSVVSNTLPLHGLQHARPPCPSPTPRVHPNSCPLSRWCHPTSYPLSSPSPPALNLSQHQGLFKWVSSSHQVAKVLEFQPQHQSFQWTPRTDPLGWTSWISLQTKGLSRVFSNTTVQKHQLFGIQLSLQSNSNIHTWLLEKPQPWLDKPVVTICSDFGAPQNKVCHCFHCFPIYLPWSDGTRCHDLSVLNVEL